VALLLLLLMVVVKVFVSEILAAAPAADAAVEIQLLWLLRAAGLSYLQAAGLHIVARWPARDKGSGAVLVLFPG
jgi:hypothetical protein